MKPSLAALAAAFLALAGCAAPQGLDDASQPVAPEATPTPVAIDESLDITLSGASDSWNFVVAPGATVAHVRFTLEGAQGQPVHVEREQPCLKWNVATNAGTKTGSQGTCSSAGNVNVALGVANTLAPKDLLSWDLAGEPGTYTFSFSADPGTAVALLHTVITVEY